jgi:hypothetical protein
MFNIIKEEEIEGFRYAVWKDFHPFDIFPKIR